MEFVWADHMKWVAHIHCRTQRYTINFEMQLKPLIVGVNLKFSSICMVVCCLRAKHSLHKRKLL